MPFPSMVKLPFLAEISGFNTARRFFRKLEAMLIDKMNQHRDTLEAHESPRDLMDVLLLRVAKGPNANKNSGHAEDSGMEEEVSSGGEDEENERTAASGMDVASPFHPENGDETIINIFVDLFTAGIETTVSTLSWTFLYMLRYPEVQERVHRELDEVNTIDFGISFF